MFQYTEPFILSEAGSDRGTAYRFSNKAVTLGDKTHVVWTDTVAITRGRTFDHAAGRWGETVTLGEGVDNHNSPSLTADAQGRLRVAYGPHGIWGHYPESSPWAPGSFKHAVGSEPGGFEGMDKPSAPFGYRGTYPCLVTTHAGRDCIVYRGGEHPPSLFFQIQREQGGWTQARELMRQNIAPGYTHYGAQVAVDRQDTLYVAGHFYSGGPYQSLGVGVLKSSDYGQTWQDLRGCEAPVPVRYDERWAAPAPAGDPDPRLHGLAVDPRGRLWVLVTGTDMTTRGALLSCWAGDSWQTLDLAKHLPQGYNPVYGDLTFDRAGRLHAVLAAGEEERIRRDERDGTSRVWGHPSQEVFHLASADGGQSFHCARISDGGPEANWLPNLSKAGPHHPVDRPVILYTQGRTNVDAREGCKTSTHTNICVVMAR